jgi:signal peptidase I
MELNWFLSASAGLVLFLLIKRYCFDIKKINSQDMMNTLYPGDAVLVKRIGNSYMTGDIVYFEFPTQDSIQRRTMFIQRLYGMPGDSFELREKEIYLNGMKLEDTSTVKYNYFVKTRNYKPDSNFTGWYNLVEGGEISDAFDFSYSLTKSERNRLGRDSAVKSVKLKSEKKKNFDIGCFPHHRFFRWNRDFYGPVYIPKMNDTIQLDSVNFAFYESIIRRHEKNEVELRHDSIFINGQHANEYVIKKNYFFTLGDNRDNANDSRSWGFVPENMIAGKVISVLRYGEGRVAYVKTP